MLLSCALLFWCLCREIVCRDITRFIKPWLETSPHSSVCNVMVLDVPLGLTVNISFHHGYHSILVASSQWTLKKYWFLVIFGET